jgi:hypothetical protein
MPDRGAAPGGESECRRCMRAVTCLPGPTGYCPAKGRGSVFTRSLYDTPHLICNPADKGKNIKSGYMPQDSGADRVPLRPSPPRWKVYRWGGGRGGAPSLHSHPGTMPERGSAYGPSHPASAIQYLRLGIGSRPYSFHFSSAITYHSSFSLPIRLRAIGLDMGSIVERTEEVASGTDLSSPPV